MGFHSDDPKVNKEIDELIDRYGLLDDKRINRDNTEFFNELDEIINRNKRDVQRRMNNQIRKKKIKKLNDSGSL